MAKQVFSKVLETLTISKATTAEQLVKLTGRPLGSPIQGKEVGDTFTATLNGKIEIRDFDGQKGAYFLTVEGYSLKVHSGFNSAVHKAEAKVECICREFDGRKYSALAS